MDRTQACRPIPSPGSSPPGAFKAIDQIRRRARFDAVADEISDSLYPEAEMLELSAMEPIEDDMLRLIFTCCHPTLPADAQVALALREVCGLTTEEIAHAFLVPAPTIAQRIVRAKNRIAPAVPYEVPDEPNCPTGWSRCSGHLPGFQRGLFGLQGRRRRPHRSSAEAIRLGRLLTGFLPDREANGLLALMLLQDSRRLARSDASGDLVLLADQDRTRWDHGEIVEGLALVDAVDAGEMGGRLRICRRPLPPSTRGQTAAATNWRRIAALYERLLDVHPSPVVELNRAVAISMCDGPPSALKIADAIIESGASLRNTTWHMQPAPIFSASSIGSTRHGSAYETALRYVGRRRNRHSCAGVSRS